MKLSIANIVKAFVISALVYLANASFLTVSKMTGFEEKQFKSYTETLKNIKQRLVFLSLLTESQLENHKLLSAEEVELTTELSFNDMIVAAKPDDQLDYVEAVARKVLHDTEVYLAHEFEKQSYFLYFRSFTNDKFILQRPVEGIDSNNIGFDLNLCNEHEYCVLSAWRGQLRDRILVSKPFESVLMGHRTLSLMAPVYLNKELVGEYAAMLELNPMYRSGQVLDIRLSDGNRNLEVYYPHYPLSQFTFNKSFVIDNFNVMVYKYPMTKALVDYVYLWAIYFVLIFLFVSKQSQAQEQQVLLEDALTDITKDELTGLYNRRLFKDETFIARLDNGPYTVIAIDGDRIKRINDKYGHHVGDDAISIIAESMQKVFRNSDYLVRTGGDEFLAVLPGCNLTQASALSKKLQDSVKDNRLKSLDIDISVSTGLATAEAHESLEDVIIRADEELYEMKKQRA